MRGGLSLVLLLASSCPAFGRLVSVADLHGDFDRTVTILASAKLIDEAGAFLWSQCFLFSLWGPECS